MRLAVLAMVGYAACFGQSVLPDKLSEFLALTPVQITQVVQLNAALDQAVNPRQQRIYAIQAELQAEYAKDAPDPLALGQRYQEITSTTAELAGLRAGVLAKVMALLTDAQKMQVQKIASAAVQQNLIADATCGYLADQIQIPSFAVRSGDFSTFVPGALISVNVFANTTASSSAGCGLVFPISIRNFLSLSDAQVSAIQALIVIHDDFVARKQNRTSQVQTEIRDETAKDSPDPLALGIRYVELIEISQEVQRYYLRTEDAAKALLNPAQAALLMGLTDAGRLHQYLPVAESCHFLATPAGVSSYYDLGNSCGNYF